MPKAEVGSTKHLSNKMKSKGLQRLRWYCQVCEKQCRDENGFKMHTQSESHVRQMLVVGEDPKKYLNEFSNQFVRDFLQLLKTGHGEKEIHINRFYQEYIANKEHVHLNATKWPSLTEFAKYLGREGICRVEENDKGIHIAWIDTSPEALRRQDALRRKEAQDRGNEEVEQMMIREQIKRAQQAAAAAGNKAEEDEVRHRELRRDEGEKIKLSFGAKPTAAARTKPELSPPTTSEKGPEAAGTEGVEKPKEEEGEAMDTPTEKSTVGSGAVSMKLAPKPQTKNVFAQARKNALTGGGGSKKNAFAPPKKVSEAERIMREDLERMEKKRAREAAGPETSFRKKQKTDR